MIGGLTKTTSRLAIATAFAAFASTGAMAASLGGNCCSDLEERVAELEATTARKGNRKVSLQVSGHVHQAIIFWDVDSSQDAQVNESNVYIGTHNSSRSRFRFKGSAKIDSDWSAGFYIEIGIRRNSLVSLNQDNNRVNAGLDIRHEALYVKSKKMGTIWLGHTSSAADGITEICLGCGLGNSVDWSDDLGGFLARGGVTFRNHGASRGVFAGEGDRREMIRYISPELSGFVFSAAWGGDDFWDIAVRYANEFNGIRVAAGIGYQESSDTNDAGGLTCGVAGDPVDCRALGMSASVQHVASGVYIYGAYGYDEDDSVFDNGRDDGWHVSIGVNRKFNPIGKTNIYALYGESDREIGAGAIARELTWFGVGVNQKIDAAAMEMYLWYKHFEATDPNLAAGAQEADFDVVTFGARIKF